MKLLTAAAFYRLLQRIIKLDIPVDVGDFRLMSRRVVEYFREVKRKRPVCTRLSELDRIQANRRALRAISALPDETKFPYRKMIKFALDGITSFSDVPLKLATWLGYFTSFLALLYLCSVFVQKALGYTVQGWATIMVAVLFIGGVQLISLGIIGEYVGRIFNETKQRPLYVIDEIYESGTVQQSQRAVGGLEEYSLGQALFTANERDFESARFIVRYRRERLYRAAFAGKTHSAAIRPYLLSYAGRKRKPNTGSPGRI